MSALQKRLARTLLPYPKKSRHIPIHGEEVLLTEETTITASTSLNAKRQQSALHAAPRKGIHIVGTVSTATSIVRNLSQWYVYVGKRPLTSVMDAALLPIVISRRNCIGLLSLSRNTSYFCLKPDPELDSLKKN
jgi:hypothetical protein